MPLEAGVFGNAIAVGVDRIVCVVLEIGSQRAAFEGFGAKEVGAPLAIAAKLLV